MKKSRKGKLLIRVGEIIVDEHAVLVNAYTGSGVRTQLRITLPEKDICRIQSTDSTGTFNNLGAVQTLAKDFDGGMPETLERVLIKTEIHNASIVVKAVDSPLWISINQNPFELHVMGAKERKICTLSGFVLDNHSLRVDGPLHDGEYIYGLGQRFNGVNQRNRVVRIWAEDRWNQIEDNSYVPIPFFLSTRGYGLFLNRFERSIFDLGATDANTWFLITESPWLDLYLFFAASPKKIVGDFNRICGGTPIPPSWSFTPWVSRHLRLRELSSVNGVRTVVEKMQACDLPWGVIILEGWETYDVEKYDDLKTIVAELHAKGKKVLLYHTMGRLEQKFWPSQNARVEYFVRDKQNNPRIKEAPHFNYMDAPNRKESCFIDITSQRAITWWKEQVWGRLLDDIGIDGSKIDFEEQFPEDDGLRFESSISPKGMHQYYPVKYNTMMYRLFQERRPQGGICWCRGGGIGAQRYPFIWCGDQTREFSRLRAIVSAILSSGFSGIPFMGHDLGGYMPARKGISDNEDEVFVRGTQLACFSPVMQFHGTAKPPYDFPQPIIDIYRFYSKLRYILLPYLKEQAEISCKTGLPLMRHLYLEYPDDPEVRDIEDEYMLGEQMLVAPVLDSSTARDIYLPAGKWQSLWNDQIYIGPTLLKAYPSPLDRIPVFLRCCEPQSIVIMNLYKNIRKLTEEERTIF